MPLRRSLLTLGATLACEMDQTIETVRRLAMRTLELVPEMQREGVFPERPNRNASSELPYRRECLPVCQLVYAAATQLGLGVRLVLGAFQDDTDPEPLAHAWIDTADGTIIDPTSAQMGLEVCAVIPSSDPRHAWYQPRRRVEGDDVLEARLDDK
jgi:hypothetical protein